MIRGIYATMAGMNVQISRTENASYNLSNASLPGFKKDRIIVKPFKDLVQLSARQLNNTPLLPSRSALGETNHGAAVDQVYTDLSNGQINTTNNNTDFALQREGFFTLTDPDNEENIYYTRNGNFSVDHEGYLVNSSGFRVMGENGAITVNDEDSFWVDNSGNVMEGDIVVNTFEVVTFDNPNNLQRLGNTLFQAQNEQPIQVEEPIVIQNCLENANVDPVKETVELTSAARAYETGQKVIQSQDSMLDMAINKVGLLR